MSVIQGGYGFPALHPAVYQYMVTGTYLDLNIPFTDVPDAGVRALIDQVCQLSGLWISHILASVWVSQSTKLSTLHGGVLLKQ